MPRAPDTKSTAGPKPSGRGPAVAFDRRTAARRNGSCSSIAKWRSGTAGWSPSAPTTCCKRWSTGRESARIGRSFPPEGKVRDDLDIAEYTDPIHNPMIPHTIVLEPGLVVFKCHNGYWYFARPTVEELRHDLRDVLRRCRPDWDLSEPGLRAAWARGEKSRFYLYGKSR